MSQASFIHFIKQKAILIKINRTKKHESNKNRTTHLLCRRCLKGIHSRSDTNRTGAEGLSFYYPRLLHCLNQMLAVVSLSQHRVLSSKTFRPCGAQCIGHAVSTWSVVCSEAPHSQFGEGARPYFCAWTNGITQHQSAGSCREHRAEISVDNSLGPPRAFLVLELQPQALFSRSWEF